MQDNWTILRKIENLVDKLDYITAKVEIETKTETHELNKTAKPKEIGFVR